MKLYVKDIVREPKDNSYTFLCKILRLNFNGLIKSTVDYTYYDSNFKNLQCISGKHRSFDDLVKIVKTYFRVSDKTIAKNLKKILDKNDNLMFVLCNSAHKWILNSHLNKSEIIKYCARYNKSDYKTNECGIYGEYSFDDIITLMGLTKEELKINN